MKPKTPLIPPTKNAPNPKEDSSSQSIQIQGDPVAVMDAIQRNASDLANTLYKAKDLVRILYQALEIEKAENVKLKAEVGALKKKPGK